jgi:bleomycin hydrolase
LKAEITPEDILQMRAAFDADPKNTVALNAVTKMDARDAALNRDAYNRINHTYSNHIDTGTITAQGMTGRCWMFAGLNVMRIYAMRNMKLKHFEFSQSYLMFWDKLEKGNYFLENIIATRGNPTDSRLVMWLLSNIIPDAGQWDMYVNLVKKYGVVPKKVMPETISSSTSRIMNTSLIGKLRDYAKKLRDMHDAGKTLDEMRAAKNEYLEEYYRMVCIHLGKPPVSFEYSWRDTDNEYQRETGITPLEFYDKYVKLDMDDMVCIINSPTKDKPFNKMYTVEYLGNVVGGEPVRYLNLDMDIMIKSSVDMIKDNHPVWFGADAGKYSHRDLGAFITDIYDYKALYGTDVEMDKGARLDYGQSKMGHAMVFTGVDIDDDGKPTKWRVENSWGDKYGEKGFYTMNTDWFREYNFEVIVHKDYVPEEYLKTLKTEPVKLPPWDPMGALA